MTRAEALVDDLFRREAGKIAAWLARLLGPARLDLIEDAVQDAFGAALARWPLDGASDHLVSEALYLSDPDGNGIEIYRDRPRAQWPRANGQIRMATLPLDVDELLSDRGHVGSRDSSARSCCPVTAFVPR